MTLVASACFVGACGGREPAPAGGPPHVAASIVPLGDLTRMVAGEDLVVDVLVPPRADPSTFEPSPQQLRDLVGARAFLLVGGGMDDWSQAVLGATEGVPTVRLNETVRLREGGRGEGTGDPHTWLDPILVRDIWLPRIVDALSAARPDARDRIAANGRALADSLTALDAYMTERLAPVRGRSFVATHSAWNYLGARYGIQELGSVYPSPGQEPSSRELAELVDQARDKGVRAVFTEPQLGETGARALAGELGVPVHVLDPLGGPGLEGRETYLNMMRFNTDQIADALAEAP